MAGIAVHAVGFALYYPGDVNFYLLPWYEHIVEAGPIGAFRAPFGNYSPPYLYLLAASTLVPTNDPVIIIKLLSLLGGMWLAVAGYRLMVACSKPRPEIAALLLFLPTVMLNTSILSQTDTFWVAPCVSPCSGAAPTLICNGGLGGRCVCLQGPGNFFRAVRDSDAHSSAPPLVSLVGTRCDLHPGFGSRVARRLARLRPCDDLSPPGGLAA